MEIRKEIGLETENSTNIHETHATFPVPVIVFMELSLGVYTCVCMCYVCVCSRMCAHIPVAGLTWATQHKITMDYDECCDL